MTLSNNTRSYSVHKNACSSFKWNVYTSWMFDLFIDHNPFVAIFRHLNDIACYGGSTNSCRWWPRNRYCWPTAFYNVGLSRCTWCFCVKNIIFNKHYTVLFCTKIYTSIFYNIPHVHTYPDSGPSPRSIISFNFYVKTLLLYISIITLHLGNGHIQFVNRPSGSEVVCYGQVI